MPALYYFIFTGVLCIIFNCQKMSPMIPSYFGNHKQIISKNHFEQCVQKIPLNFRNLKYIHFKKEEEKYSSFFNVLYCIFRRPNLIVKPKSN